MAAAEMQQGGLPRGYPSAGNSVLDFGRFGGPPPAAANQGRPLSYLQGGFLEEQGYAGLGETAAYGGVPPPPGGYGQYVGAQLQAGFGGGFPTSKLPTFPPPQPPAGMVSTSSSPAPTGGQMAAGHLAQPDLSRALLAQPPPPPSQAPTVPPAQPPAPQGPPPSAPPLMSVPAHPSQPTRGSDAAEDVRKKEELLYFAAPEAERAARDKYGLLGLLKVIRMTDLDLNTLALGMDLTTLGLNLNSPDCLHATFASPWSDTPARKEPEMYLPSCYYMNPPQLKTAHLQKFSLETLFYIFFNMPRDTLQACAAAELYNRGWKYHRDLKTWFIMQEEDASPRWVCFDPNTWEKHFYLQPLDTASFLGEDDVRVKMPASAGAQAAPPAG